MNTNRIMLFVVFLALMFSGCALKHSSKTQRVNVPTPQIETVPTPTASTVKTEDVTVSGEAMSIRTAGQVRSEKQVLPETRHTETRQLGPLVTQTKTSNGESKTDWNLVVPRRPSDRNTQLTEAQMEAGLQIIRDSLPPAELEKFVKEFNAIPTGTDTWDQAEKLVLQKTNGRAKTTANTSPSVPSTVIVRDAASLKAFFGLDPAKMKPIKWGGNPMKKDCNIQKRADLAKTFPQIEGVIDRIFRDYPQNAEAWKKTMRSCVAQAGDSEYCKDVYVRDYPFLQRNYGANSMGEEEVHKPFVPDPQHPDVVFLPDAKMTIYWVKDLGWKGNGWACCGNPLEFFETISMPVGVTELVPKPKPPAPAKCVGLLTFTEAKTNALGQVELFPSQSVTFAAQTEGLTDQHQITQEQWRVDGQPRLGGKSEFTFSPADFNYRLGVHSVDYFFRDQFGNQSVCPAKVVNVVAPPAPPPPPPVISRIPPREVPPTEGHNKKRFCGPAGVYCWGPPVAAGVIYALTRGKTLHKYPVPAAGSGVAYQAP